MNPNKTNRLLKLILRVIPNKLIFRFYHKFSFFDFVQETKNTQTPISIENWYNQKILNKNGAPYWPCHETSLIQGWRNIYCGIETCPGYSPGNFISAHEGKIYIGDYTQIAPNVGIIASNHSLHDNRLFESKDIHIGKYCWIGMGAIILPGVVLGDYTVVGAGAIVTKSFEEGYQVIGGNPARVIKKIDPEKCVFHESEIKYNGYIKNSEFESFRKRELNC
jgi:carbonic anhydrase/acetyltransferase-like protein (isoleucine patch superfamily)